MRDLKLFVCVFILAFSFPAWVVGQQENPMYTSWQNHQPGTKVTLHTVTKQNGTVVSETKQTQKLVEITDDHVVIEIGSVIIAAGQEIDGGSTTMTFQRILEAGEAPETDASIDVNITKGEETVDIKGEKFACEWIESEFEVSGMKTTSKVWTSTEVPGLNVKSVVNSAGTVSETTLVGIEKP
ncbi:MAG: hypothetical protein ACR2NP_06280 [Pirellulaceae bacterium]